MTRLKIAFMASGNGTLFEALAGKCRAGKLNADAVLLISSDASAPVMRRAEHVHVPSIVLERKAFATEQEFADAMLSALRTHDANFVCLAGYLKLIPPEAVRAFHHRMLNIHPALLPAFGGKGMYGRRVHEAAVNRGVRISGATVHVVDEEFDHGPIVLQRAVFVKPDDTPDTLATRVHAIEYDLYTDAVRLFCDDRIRIENHRVTILPRTTHD
ncbi:MAG: phosphoribosylglycinamide formyltransferase [bacterium]|nr:phosphoribosylglycinamide formyltransferase [bacterium]